MACYAALDCHAGEIRALARAGELDLVTFTSASNRPGLRGPRWAGEDLSGLLGVCIGEQTAAEARRHGIPAVVARKATIDALTEAVVAAAGEKGAADTSRDGREG